jgi:hypothetical protein
MLVASRCNHGNFMLNYRLLSYIGSTTIRATGASMVTNAVVRVRTSTASALTLFAHAASAGDFLGIDHRLGVDNDGLWGRRQQHIILGTMVASEILLGLWEGGDSRLGRTDWQAIDASLISAVSSEALKRSSAASDQTVLTIRMNGFVLRETAAFRVAKWQP